MPLTVSPVVFNPSKTPQGLEQGRGRQAVHLKLSLEAVRALAEALNKAKELKARTGEAVNPLQVLLSGENPVRTPFIPGASQS